MKFTVLSEGNIEQIHEATLEILQNVGVWFKDSSQAQSLFIKNGCQVESDRVRFPPELVTECIERLPDRNTLRLCVTKLGFSEALGLTQGESHVGLIGNPYYFYDYEKGQRNLQESDADAKFLVLDSLPRFKFDFACLINESQRLGKGNFPDYQNRKFCLEYLRNRLKSRLKVRSSKKPAIHANILHGEEPNPRIHSPRVLKPLEKMELLRHTILHGAEETETLLAQDTPLVWCNPISPLQYHSEQVREITDCIQELGPSCFIMFSPQVMCGATGPVTIAGSLAQHNAEVLGGVILTQLLAPGTPVIYGSVTGVMDLRVAEISLGNYESMLFNAGVVQLADYYGIPSRVQSGNTSARHPGVRAIVETAWGLQMAIAAGANLISTGLLDSSLLLSLEHLVLVDEMVSEIQCGENASQISPENLAKEIIYKEGHPNPNYIGHPHTLEHMKEVVYYSDFTGRVPNSYKDWYTMAHEKVQAVLSRDSAEAEQEKMIQDRFQAAKARMQEDDTRWRDGKDDWWKFYIQDLYS